MITHTHLERWADVLVRHAVDLKPGQIVRITAQPEAEALLEAVYRATLQAGAHAIVNCRPESLGEAFYELANEDQLDWINPLSLHETELVDATINLSASTNLRAMDKVDPARPQRAAKANQPNREVFFQRAAAADDPELAKEHRPLLWSTTLYPTNAYAQQAGMSLKDYSAFVVQACQLNQEDH